MAFYIRKAFKTGPIRLNLSKGGLGLSAGITGARIGINTRGTYVHAGRHGLYYRKYLKQGNRSDRSPSSKGAGYRNRSQFGPIDIFHDTGVTFNSKKEEPNIPSTALPNLPSSEILTPGILLGIFLMGALTLLSLIADSLWLIIPAILLFITFLGWLGIHLYWRNKVENHVKRIVNQVEETQQFTGITFPHQFNLPERWNQWLHSHIHFVVSELAFKHSEIETVSMLRKLEREVPIQNGLRDQIRALILNTIIDELLEDHMISKEEDRSVRNLIEELNLSDSLLKHQLSRLNDIRTIRKEMERPLKEMDPGIPLVRGEAAFEVFKEVRLLNERVINRFQRERIQYRELGYDIDIEGKLIITDRRLIIVGRGSREYRLNQLLNITCDPEGGIVELTMSNRKTPLIITVTEPMILAARLEMIINEIVGK